METETTEQQLNGPVIFCPDQGRKQFFDPFFWEWWASGAAGDWAEFTVKSLSCWWHGHDRVYRDYRAVPKDSDQPLSYQPPFRAFECQRCGQRFAMQHYEEQR